MQSINSRHSNDDAIAYGWFMIGAFIILGAFTYFVSMAIYNVVIVKENVMITANQSSQATKDALTFNRDMSMYLPVFMLIGVFVWAMVRGIGGSGATFQTFYFGYVILFLSCFIAFMMSFAGGVFIDKLYTALDDKGYIGSPGLSTPWANAQMPGLITLMNIYYGLCYITPFIGLAVYFQSIAKRTSGSQYVRMG
jgi:uncharacterized membrane protein